MLAGLLGILGLGASVVCGPDQVDLLGRLNDEDSDFASGSAVNAKAAKLPNGRPSGLVK